MKLADLITEATGKEVEHQLTTDYAIAIETLVNNNADLAFTGARLMLKQIREMMLYKQ